MTPAPTITIYTRHGADCKHAGDEFAKRCACRKWLRWTQDGIRQRRKANTRSWAEAEQVKRDLEDQLSGRGIVSDVDTKNLRAAITVFIQNKTVERVSVDVIGKYTRELERLARYCERQNVYTVSGLTRELLTGYCATFKAEYPSTQTQSAVRSRLRAFLRYGYEAQWLPRIPALPKITVDEPPTMPLSADEYQALLDAVTVHPEPDRQRRVRALIQLMRWSGLAIRDALTIPKAKITHVAAKSIYRVQTSRQKTGTHVSVAIPTDVALELLAIPGTAPYVFWDGESDIVKTWTKYYIAPVFKAAGVVSEGNMVSHRLRDTFAVDLLEKGVPMEEVSKALGHTSIKTTERHYAKWVKGRQDRMDALIAATWV